MAQWTEDELKELRRLRKQATVEEERRFQKWHAAKPGFSESETVYVIEYRVDEDPTWYGASPFFDPVRARPEETRDKDEAIVVSVEIVEGRRGVTRQSDPSDKNITGVRVIERHSVATILSEAFAPGST